MRRSARELLPHGDRGDVVTTGALPGATLENLVLRSHHVIVMRVGLV